MNPHHSIHMGSYTKSDMTISTYDQDRVEPLFSIPSWEALELSLKLNKYELKEIEIIKDQTITESHDFGYTYI